MHRTIRDYIVSVTRAITWSQGRVRGGHGAAAAIVRGVVIVLILKSSMRGAQGWFQILCKTFGSLGTLIIDLHCNSLSYLKDRSKDA